MFARLMMQPSEIKDSSIEPPLIFEAGSSVDVEFRLPVETASR